MTCQCVCGGTLTANPRSPGDVHAAVVCHNRTPEHREWRSEGGFRSPTFHIPVLRVWKDLDGYENRIVSL